MSHSMGALRRSAEWLARGADRDAVLDAALDLLISEFGARAALVWLCEDDTRSLQLNSYRSASTGSAEGVKLSSAVALRPRVEVALRAKRPVVLEIDADLLTDPGETASGRNNLALIPLMVGSEVVGVLGYVGPAEREAGKEEALATFAAILALALDRICEGRPRGDGERDRAAVPAGEDADEEAEVIAHQLGVSGTSALLEAQLLHSRLMSIEHEARTKAETLAAELDAVLRQMVEGVIVADLDGRISFANEASRRLLGVGRAGMSLEEYAEAFEVLTLDGEVVPPEERSLTRALFQGETSINQERRVRRADGSEIITESSAVPLFAADGTRVGAMLTVRDITAQRNLEQQKDEFLAAVAHDLKSPLATVQGYTQLLQLRTERAGDPAARLFEDGLRRIESTTRRMARYVDELLDATRMQMGRQLDLQSRSIDLIALARQVVAERQEETVGHRIEIETDLQELVGSWDDLRLERVLTNLVANAVKYSPEGGTITVSIGREEDPTGASAILAVRDQGIGILAADLPHIFDRFYRGQNVPRHIPGTGIGLTTVRYIVERQGGTVSAASAEGRGSVFTVRLPV